jgi:hypothetical protein
MSPSASDHADTRKKAKGTIAMSGLRRLDRTDWPKGVEDQREDSESPHDTGEPDTTPDEHREPDESRQVQRRHAEQQPERRQREDAQRDCKCPELHRAQVVRRRPGAEGRGHAEQWRVTGEDVVCQAGHVGRVLRRLPAPKP